MCPASVTATLASITNAVTSATTYSSPQWCSYTRVYYTSRAYICSAAISGNPLNVANNALNSLAGDVNSLLNYGSVKKATNMLGAIIGGVIGGIVFIIILICICCYCCCKKAADATKSVANAVPTQVNVSQQPMMQPVMQPMMQPQPMMMQPQPMMMQPQPMMMGQPAPIVINV